MHLGPGAFHRAHQAWFVDGVLAARSAAGESAACPCASADVSTALAEQDNLLHAGCSRRTDLLPGDRRDSELLVAPEDPGSGAAATDCAPRRTLVTHHCHRERLLSCRGRLARPPASGYTEAIFATHARPRASSAFSTEALRRRREAGIPRRSRVVSCDNLRRTAPGWRKATARSSLGRGSSYLAGALDTRMKCRSRARWSTASRQQPHPTSSDRSSKALGPVRRLRWPVQREAASRSGCSNGAPRGPMPRLEATV